jgi:hypothetical protein
VTRERLRSPMKCRTLELNDSINLERETEEKTSEIVSLLCQVAKHIGYNLIERTDELAWQVTEDTQPTSTLLESTRNLLYFHQLPRSCHQADVSTILDACPRSTIYRLEVQHVMVLCAERSLNIARRAGNTACSCCTSRAQH